MKWKISIVIIAVSLVTIAVFLGIIFVQLNVQRGGGILCPDGTVVSDYRYCRNFQCPLDSSWVSASSFCPKYRCPDGSEHYDYAKCPVRGCKIDYGPKYRYGSRVKDVTCTDATGQYWASSDPVCDWDNPSSNIPGQGHRSSLIMKESLSCINNRCRKNKILLRDCNVYDTKKEKGLCGSDPEKGAGCALYARDGSYGKSISAS